MGNVRSRAIDNGKTRVVVVIEGTSAVVHATKYGSAATTLVTATMRKADAYELGLWLVQHARP